MNEKKVLEKFLNMDLSSSREVMEEFSSLKKAVVYPEIEGSDGCIYIPGRRKDRVLLVAHADTVYKFKGNHKVVLDYGCYISGEENVGIGADDRAGCAIVYLLRTTGHSILITDGEEQGIKGGHSIKKNRPELFAELNSHNYMIEFDKMGNKGYKVYDIPVTGEFLGYLESNTGYKRAPGVLHTDIVVLSRKICGVNLSVGYDREHTGEEFLNFEYWKNTLDTARSLLEGQQPKFPVDNRPRCIDPDFPAYYLTGSAAVDPFSRF